MDSFSQQMIHIKYFRFLYSQTFISFLKNVNKLKTKINMPNLYINQNNQLFRIKPTPVLVSKTNSFLIISLVSIWFALICFLYYITIQLFIYFIYNSKYFPISDIIINATRHFNFQ